MRYQIYTDGACEPNPGKGAWSFVVVEKKEILDLQSGIDDQTTNNRMEYLAVIRCLELYGPMTGEIYSDSRLLVNTCNEWRYKWKSFSWRKSVKGQEIKNVDLVKRLDELLDKNKHVQVKWIKGHSGNIFNEAADQLATDTLKRTFGVTPRIWKK